MRVLPILLVLIAVPVMAKKAPEGPPPIPPCAGAANGSPGFGCANAHNLDEMVADQRDLVRGRDTGGSDAILEAAAVVRLRTDRVKRLRSNSTISQTTGGE